MLRDTLIMNYGLCIMNYELCIVNYALKKCIIIWG